MTQRIWQQRNRRLTETEVKQSSDERRERKKNANNMKTWWWYTSRFHLCCLSKSKIVADGREENRRWGRTAERVGAKKKKQEAFYCMHFNLLLFFCLKNVNFSSSFLLLLLSLAHLRQTAWLLMTILFVNCFCRSHRSHRIVVCPVVKTCNRNTFCDQFAATTKHCLCRALFPISFYLFLSFLAFKFSFKSSNAIVGMSFFICFFFENW